MSRSPRSTAAVSAAAAVLVAGASLAGAAPSETGGELHPGIYVGTVEDPAVPVRVHVVEVDLSSAQIRLRATAEGERGQKTSAWAAGVGSAAAVAVNGDLFAPVGYVPAGLARGGAAGAVATWGIGGDTAAEGFLIFDREGGTNHARISPPEDIVPGADLGPAVEGVVGGRPLLVSAGVAAATFDCADVVTLACERAPRTAVGLSADGRTLYLVVVDGWQPGSAGWTAAELAAFMAARGAHDALAFDGGAASTLVVPEQAGLASSPSDGAERPVANHLAVLFGALPPGTLLGFIREGDVFTGPNISNATVTLDDGASQLVTAEARYTFTGREPRYTCATASAPGYVTATACKTVVSGTMVFNSIALFKEGMAPDAGPPPPDASLPGPPDAAVAPGADGGDGGGDNPGDGGDTGGDLGGGPCGCRAGGAAPTRPGAALVACMALAFGAMLRRRRRKPILVH